MNHKQEEMPLFFKEMLQELIKRRNKLIQMEKATKIWTYFCLGCIAALVLLAFYAFSFGAFKSGFNYHKLFHTKRGQTDRTHLKETFRRDLGAIT